MSPAIIKRSSSKLALLMFLVRALDGVQAVAAEIQAGAAD